MAETDAVHLLHKPSCSWDAFYARNEKRFFKDRHWLLTEFPEFLSTVGDGAESAGRRRVVLEVGCGVGNTVFPLLAHCKRNGINDVFVYCCDYSSTAIELVRAHDDYDTSMCHAFVWDITVC
jgi:SAM-dependent methyltransferase